MTPPLSGPELLAEIVTRECPDMVPAGPWSYRVTSVLADGRCHLTATRKGPPASIGPCDQWSGAGTAARPAVGSLVAVSFLDGDPSQPMIATYQPLRISGGKPDEVKIDADVVKIGPTASTILLAVGPTTIAHAVARVGDTVSLGYLTATGVAPGAPIVFVLSPIDPTPTPSAHLTGTITSGSGKVTSG